MSSSRVLRQVSLVAIFVVAAVVSSMAEATYDMAFVDTALTFSDQVVVVGWIYCAGYLTEAFASVTLGSKIDSWGPLRAMAIFVALVAVTLTGVGLADVAFGVSSVILVVASAAVIDYLNQLVAIAHEAALPEAFGDDESGLIRFAGIDSSVRSVASIASPVVAGFIIFQVPGFRALLVVAVLYALGYALLTAFLLQKARHRVGITPTAHAAAPAVLHHVAQPQSSEPRALTAEATGDASPPGQSSASQEVAEPTDSSGGFRATASTIWASTSWRWFLIVDVFATMALSSVLLLLYSLFVHEFQFSPPEAGTLLGSLALGSLTAAVFVSRGTKAGMARLFGIGSLCAGVGSILLAISNGSLLSCVAATIVLGCGSVLQLKAMTLLVQLNAPKGRIASWFSVFDATERVVNAVAIVAIAYCMDRFGGGIVFAAMGAILIASGAVWMLIRKAVWQSTDASIER